MSTADTRWGYTTWVSKDMAADPEVDVYLFLENDFKRSVPSDMTVMGDVEWEWVDADGHPMNLGATLDDGTVIPPVENMWFVRGTAVVA